MESRRKGRDYGDYPGRATADNSLGSLRFFRGGLMGDCCGCGGYGDPAVNRNGSGGPGDRNHRSELAAQSADYGDTPDRRSDQCRIEKRGLQNF